MYLSLIRSVFPLIIALVIIAPEYSRAQTNRIVSAESLWNMLGLPQPKYSCTGWGAGNGLSGGAWLDVGNALSNPTNLPGYKLFKIDLKAEWSPKGNEAFPRETTPDLHMLIHEFETPADAETAWKDGFDVQYVQRARVPSSAEQLAKLSKWINSIGQPENPAKRESMIKAGREIPPPGTLIKPLQTSTNRLEDVKLGPVKDESYTTPEGDNWQIVSVREDSSKRRRIIKERWVGSITRKATVTERLKKVKDEKKNEEQTFYVYEKRTKHSLGPHMLADHREYDFFLIHDCVVIVQWFSMVASDGTLKNHPPEWKSKILPTLEKLSGSKLQTAPPPVTPEKERVETLHVKAEGYRPLSLKVNLPAGSNGWHVMGKITDGKTGVAKASLRWDGSSTITRSDAQGQFVKPFGMQGATPTVVQLDVNLDKSPPIKIDITEGNVTHTFLPFPIQGQDRTVQLVFTADGTNALVNHRGIIKFLNAKQLPFISIDAQPETLDATGKWSVSVTVRKLEPSETFSLADLPMAAEFEATIEPPRWHTPIAKANFAVPLGAFVMMGSTVGPDYKKRYTPIAPKAITALHLAYPERAQAGQIRGVHLLGQVNSQGDFWTMIRAPERGDSADILLQWSNLCKVPLLLRIGGRAGYKPEMTGGKHVVNFERAWENIDLLSPDEHESRIRDLTVDFLDKMPLKSGARGDLVALVQNVKFSYDDAAARPHWNGHSIVLPGDKHKLWGEEPYGRLARGERAIYVLAFHEMGHALHEFAVEKLGRIAWVRKLTYGAAEHSTWAPPSVAMPMPTIAAPGLSWKVRRQAVAFTEATAEFFAWCMYDYLEKAHADTFGKSIYFERDYLAQFDTDATALAACHHGGFQVEGVQATFLRALYAGMAAPTAYGDFLRTMALYQDEHFFLRWVPARAIDEWVAMKIKHGGPGGNVKALASRFNIIGGPVMFLQVAQDGVVCVNSTQVAMGADNIQFLRLDVGDKVVVESGSFVVNFTATSSKQGVLDHIRIGAMAARKGCEFEVTGPFDVRLTNGKFASGGVDTAIPAGKVRHTKTSYIVEIGSDGATVVEVVDGAVEIDAASGKTAVAEGNAVHIDRFGQAQTAQPRGASLLEAEFDPTASVANDVPGTPAESSACRLDLKTSVVRPGEMIVVVHTAVPFEDPNAWIAFYRKTDDRNEDYLAYTFLRNLTDCTYDVMAPHEPGDEYHFRLFKTQGYDCVSACSEKVKVK